MKTVKFLVALFCFAAMIAFSGCKSYEVDYTSHEGTKNYSLNKDKISKKEKEAWVTATNANSVNSYKKYIKDFPDGKYSTEAQSILQNANSRNYALQKIYPNNTYDQDLAALFNSPNVSEPVMDPDKNLFVDSQTGKLFSGSYNGDQYKDGNIVNYTIGNDPDPEEEKDWLIARASSSDLKEDKKRLEEFLYKYSNGEFAAEANAKLAEINNLIKKEEEEKEKKAAADEENRKRMLALDKQAWDNAFQLNTIQGYNDYISQFPDGNYVIDATAAIQLLSDVNPNKTTGGGGNSSSGAPAPIVTTDTQIEPDTQIVTSTLTPECAANARKQGVVAYDELPKVMQLDSIYNLEIIINDISNIKKVAKDLKDKEEVDLNEEELTTTGSQTVGDFTVTLFEIGSWVRITLKELKGQEAFDITRVLPITEAELNRGLNIDCDKNAEWKWKIKPKKPGKHTLFLVMEMKDSEDGVFKPIEDSGNIEKIIEVKVDNQSLLSQLWFQLTLGGLALLSLFFIFWKNRKKKAAADYVFGVNLAAAGGMKDIATPPVKPKSVFIAYAKEDEEWTKQIYNQMKVLQKGGFANIWYDQLMEAGVEYKEEIFKHLEQSDIIILNISSDFLASDFCDELMQKALERQNKGEGVILMPIIVRPCLWATTPLAGMDVFPQNKKPLSDDEWKNVDNAIVNVMNEMEGNLLN